MDSTFLRLFVSFVVSGVWSVVETAFAVPATLVTGAVAGRQFENSDYACGVSQFTFSAVHCIGAVMSVVFLLVLLAIWWAPLHRLYLAAVANSPKK